MEMKATSKPYPLTLNTNTPPTIASGNGGRSRSDAEQNKLSINIGDEAKNVQTKGSNINEKQQPPKPQPLSGLNRRRLSWAVNEKGFENLYIFKYCIFPKISASSIHRKTNSGQQPQEEECEDASALRNDIMRLMIGDEHLLKVKVQYMEERTALNLQRPVSFQEVEQYFQVIF